MAYAAIRVQRLTWVSDGSSSEDFTISRDISSESVRKAPGGVRTKTRIEIVVIEALDLEHL